MHNQDLMEPVLNTWRKGNPQRLTISAAAKQPSRADSAHSAWLILSNALFFKRRKCATRAIAEAMSC
jgi:hypothetical protein